MIGSLLGGLLIMILVLGAWMGSFRHVEVSRRKAGPFRLIYKNQSGTDMQAVRSNTEAVAAELERCGVQQRRPMQVYFGAGQQHQIGFCIPQDQALNQPWSGGVKERRVEESDYLCVEFPWRNPASFAVGYAKVTPALSRYCQQHKLLADQTIVLLDDGVIRYLQRVTAGDQQR